MTTYGLVPGHTTSPLQATTVTADIRGYTFIVIDNSNIFRAGRGQPFRVCPELVLQRLGGDKVVSATISASTAPEERPSQNAYYERLRRLGWAVSTFDLHQDDAGQVQENEQLVDGHIRLRIRTAARSPYCDTIVVLSGDGGMTNAVKDARRAGKNVVVLAWDGTLHPALAAVASAHTSIHSLQHLIGRMLH